MSTYFLTESKLNNSFPTAQFQINGYRSPYQLDRGTHSMLEKTEAAVQRCS